MSEIKSLYEQMQEFVEKVPHDPLVSPLPNEPKQFDCILFVGDPHITSRQISSRHDTESTMISLLNKMEFIAQLSHELKALVLIEGDLLDNDKENNLQLLNRLSKILSSFYGKPYVEVGNHDKTETELTHSNMLKYLIDTHQVFEIKDNKITIKTTIAGKQVEIGGTHYGSVIPNKVTRHSRNSSHLIWMTHHDLAFGQVFYSNMQKLHEIENVDLAVNGHIHAYQPEVQVGQTTWCNTGNISRLSRDTEHHVPKVWKWTPEHHDNNVTKLIGIEIPHQKNIFRKVENIEANNKVDIVLDKQGDIHRITFTDAALAFADSNNATSDKEIVKQGINELAKQMNLPDDYQEEIHALLDSIDDLDK